MIPLDAEQMAAAVQARFFARVAEFIRLQTPLPAYSQAALDKPLRHAVWAPHWPALRHSSEHDAALFMCFLLACAVLRIDSTRAAAAIRQSTRPELSMKLFLCERGLLSPSAFDVPELDRPAVAG